MSIGGVGRITACILASVAFSSTSVDAAEPVTVDTFVRAETDQTLKRYVDQGAFGKFLHIRQPTPIDKQAVIRMNRDTLYSIGVFDLTSPVTIIKPDTGDRFQSLQIINQDHSMLPTIHQAGEFTFTREDIGTRYLFLLFRTFVNAADETDVAAANAVQDKIEVRQEDPGSFEIPDWDEASLIKLRDAINVLALTRTDTSVYFGDKSELNPLYHLLGTAAGWGGNPKEAAIYVIGVPERNDGSVRHSVTVKDVPVDEFWSITVYNAKGYMEENELGAYSFNNVTAEQNDDGSTTINFGGCDDGRANCLPITEGWNYAVRLYRPRPEIIDGTWTFPDLERVE